MTQNEVECKEFPDFLFPPDDNAEDFCITRTELEQITNAFKDDKFRKLFVEYVEEMQDPETQATYQREMRQLELERGNIVHFINPVPGYVLKTSVNGEKKGFINICSNPLIKKAFFKAVNTETDGKGNVWSIPYAQSPSRDDVDKAGSFCTVYDVIFHPDTLTLAGKDKLLKEKLENTAIECVEKSFQVTLDKNNVKIPKLSYKGLARAAAIKYKVGAPLPSVIDPTAIAVENELPPQSLAPPTKVETKASKGADMNTTPRKASSPIIAISEKSKRSRGSALKEREQRSISDGNEGDDDESWTEPRYLIKYRSHVDMQDYSLDNQKMGKVIPDELILTVDLPLLRDSSALDADVVTGGYFFELKSESRARYKLKLKLPYQVHTDTAKATFDKDKRKLVVSMRTLQKKFERSASDPSSSSDRREKEGFYFLKGESGSRRDVDEEELANDMRGAGDAGSLPNI